MTLDCSASSYKVGATLPHQLENSQMKPVTLASRSLIPAEKYSQLDQETLTIVSGIKSSISTYIPFPSILSTSKFSTSLHISTHSSNDICSDSEKGMDLKRINYTITYKPGLQRDNVDRLSRLPLPGAPKEVPLPGDTIHLLDNLQDASISVH